MYKTGQIINGKTTEYKYKNEFAIQKTISSDRLIVSTENNQMLTAFELISEATDEFGILYLLLLSRTENKPGRYQSSRSLSKNELKEFIIKYGAYLETDGRHHFWISSIKTNDMIVYDHHNVLYVYGRLGIFSEILEKKNFHKVDEIFFPEPHTHKYNKENDDYERDIIQKNEWLYYELAEGDDY